MFADLCYYFLWGGVASSCAAGLLYLYDPKKVTHIVSGVTWYGVNMYSKAIIMYENFGSEPEVITVEDEEEKEIIADDEKCSDWEEQEEEAFLNETSFF